MRPLKLYHESKPPIKKPGGPALHLLAPILPRLDFSVLGKTRSQVMTELREKGVGTQVLYIPVHLQPWYRNTYGYGVGKCPQAETAYAGLLSLPLFPAMTKADVTQVKETVFSVKGPS